MVDFTVVQIVFEGEIIKVQVVLKNFAEVYVIHKENIKEVVD